MGECSFPLEKRSKFYIYQRLARVYHKINDFGAAGHVWKGGFHKYVDFENLPCMHLVVYS